MSIPLLLSQANTLAQSGQPAEAIALYDDYLAQDPNNPAAWNNRGNVLDDLGHKTEAIASFDKALALVSNYPQALCNKGVVLNNLQQWEQALACFDECVRLDPNMAVAHSNRGNSLRSLHRYSEALASYCQATDLDPDFVSAHWYESTCRLLMGDYDIGWKKYEWRWQTDVFKAQISEALASYCQAADLDPDFVSAHWNEGICHLQQLGDSLHNKKITIWPEGGVGDAFQFIRFALTLRDADVRVAVAAPPLLLKLYQQSFHNIEVIPSLDDMAMPDSGYHCFTMSLPLVCGIDSLKKIPTPIPYLFANQNDQALWADKLNTCMASNKPRIGIAWAGNPVTDCDLERSLKLDSFASLGPIALAKNLQFVSLQKGVSAQQIHSLGANTGGEALSLNLLDMTSDLNDWADTAALIANLDLVISCDTGVAHLAAAMGKPTWILSRYNGCWRWLENRTDSPWYPSVRLFRQPTQGDWETVMQQVAHALAEYQPTIRHSATH